MTTNVLITSFDVWQDHQSSNASDDLIAESIQQDLFAEWHGNLSLLRKLPVDFQLAPQSVIAQVDAFQPDLIICCGMAEHRSLLTVESNGKHKADVLSTYIEVDRLVENLEFTEVSHDAGNFVCNYLYYSVLKHIRDRGLNCQCLFIHVPILNKMTLIPVLKDFLAILHFCQQESGMRKTTL